MILLSIFEKDIYFIPAHDKDAIDELRDWHHPPGNESGPYYYNNDM